MELQKIIDHLTRSGGHSISRCRVYIIPKYQRQFKALKEKKEVSSNQRVASRGILQTLVHYGADSISKNMISRENIKVSVTSYAESYWFGYPVEDNN